MLYNWLKKTGSFCVVLAWMFCLLPSAGFAQSDAELAATIDRLMLHDPNNVDELRQLSPRSVVVMSKLLRELPESPPRAEYYHSMGTMLMHHANVLPETEIRDAVQVLVEKRASTNESIQVSHEIVLKHLSTNPRIKTCLAELGAADVVAPSKGAVDPTDRGWKNWLIPGGAMLGVLLAGGILIGRRMSQAKRD